jgi:hypothetical protein
VEINSVIHHVFKMGVIFLLNQLFCELPTSWYQQIDRDITDGYYEVIFKQHETSAALFICNFFQPTKAAVVEFICYYYIVTGCKLCCWKSG